MSDIIEMYLPPYEMKVVSAFILNHLNIYELSSHDADQEAYREVRKGEIVLVLAKVVSSKCDSGLGYVIWDAVFKESIVIDSMLLEY
jgi:hypothetical protein